MRQAGQLDVEADARKDAEDLAYTRVYHPVSVDCAVTSLFRALACFFLELSGQPVWERFVNPVAVSVKPVSKPKPLTPERERLAQVHEVASQAIATRSTVDDKPALAMIEAISR